MTLVSGTSLSLLGRSAISQAAGARSSQRAAPERVEPTDALKDPTSREYRELQDFKLHDREVQPRFRPESRLGAGQELVRLQLVHARHEREGAGGHGQKNQDPEHQDQGDTPLAMETRCRRDEAQS